MASIRVAILEDHQSIVDGYLYRLNDDRGIEIVGCAHYGEDLEPLLQSQPVDVLILDLVVPTSADNQQPFPLFHLIPELFKKYPVLRILVISMLTESTLVNSLVDMGISGYIGKEDSQSIQQLKQIINIIATGGVYFSQDIYQGLRQNSASLKVPTLTVRQLEALSLCAAYPEASTNSIAAQMRVSPSTLRNLLSAAYERLDVRTRMAAIVKAQKMGILTAAPGRK